MITRIAEHLLYCLTQPEIMSLSKSNIPKGYCQTKTPGAERL